ncbi:MAG TPA: calcium/sodium antiporter [candidate division WOR-3 bacterium]|uniref:Calcium/sodium antiporter n=1 Tax=candidate division WOR-3 bacterium TaxID=2052148 RepID=A0A7C5HVY2_UNCW3|nr:calcium/sodium antiporter [candidate division WOR-3 bacterium]
MLLAIISVIGGFILMILGAEGFIRGGSGIAKRFNIPEYVIGATIVAIGTSLPEVISSSYAAWRGFSDISVGNVVGSNFFNMAMILGFITLVVPITVKRNIFQKDVPVFLASVFILFLISFDTMISRVEGIILLILFAGYLMWIISEKEVPEEEFAKLAPKSLWIAVLYLIAASLFLYIGSRLAIEGAVILGERLNISRWIIGVIIVAFGTSLPEFTTSIVAAFRGRRDISVGNILGSNITNVLLVIGTASTVRPLSVSRTTIQFDIPVVIFTSLVFSFMINDKKITRLSGLVLLSIFILYIRAVIGMY